MSRPQALLSVAGVIVLGATAFAARHQQTPPSQPIDSFTPSPIPNGGGGPIVGPFQTVDIDQYYRLAPYRVKDSVEGAWINLNHVPIRPMVIPSLTSGIYAVNTHDSTVEHFISGSSDPVEIFAMPWNPVSIAHWDGAGDQPTEELLVVCRGSYVLVRMSFAGEIHDVIELPTEPGDIIIDQEKDLAFISCSGANSVVQLDLVTNDQVVYGPELFTALHPLFLSFDQSMNVIVTPLLSGNNSGAQRLSAISANERVFDFSDPFLVDIPNGGDLPDEDVFRIDPDSQTVSLVARGIGTILFQHGINPSTGSLWLLNTEANNKDPNLQTEPSVNGIFASNRLTIFDFPSGVNQLSQVPQFIDLDPLDLSGAGCPTDCPIDKDRTVGQPYALEFTNGGNGLIVGLLTDNVTELDQNGGWLREWDLHDGAIPRAVLMEEGGVVPFVYVYCWGTNEILKFRYSDLVLQETFDLNHDPTPDAVKQGRELFYDAGKSANNNLSCATCHVEGRRDQLTWNLAAGPEDDKGPMATQTLSGISKLVPLHWRGEREGLIDFNGAFAGLLGGAKLDETPGGEFDLFEAFVFSIENPANPNQNPYRMLDDNIPAPSPSSRGSAIAGQNAYFDVATFGDKSCEDCHAVPYGTNNDFFPDAVGHDKPKRARFKVPAFHEMWRRGALPADQTLVWKDPLDHSQGTKSDERTYIGTGVSHAGLFKDLFTFVGAVGNLGGSSPPMHHDITSFINQLDNGLAPTVHKSYLMNAATDVVTWRDVEHLLLQQANARNCDVAIVGKVVSSYLPGSPLVESRWFGDRTAGESIAVFRSEDPLEADRALEDFQSGVSNGESNIIMGLPIGMSERFAVDYDRDGARNAEDAAPYGTDVDAGDTSSPVFVRGPAVQWATTRAARLIFVTDEWTRAEVSYRLASGPVRTKTFDDYSKTHSVMLTQLLPSTETGSFAGEFGPATNVYDVDVTVFDRNGNPPTMAPVTEGVLTEHYIDDPARREDHVISNLAFTMFDNTGTDTNGMGLLQADVDIETGFRMAVTEDATGVKQYVPAPNRVVVARVLVNGEVSESVVARGSRTFVVDRVKLVRGNDLTAVLNQPGPFLVGLETGVAGGTLMRFDQPSLSANDEVIFNIEAVVEVDPTMLFELHQDMVATEDCHRNGGPFDGDCDMDPMTPFDCCQLEIPTPSGTLPGGIDQPHPPRRLAQFAFPSTEARFRKLAGNF